MFFFKFDIGPPHKGDERPIVFRVLGDGQNGRRKKISGEK